MEELYALSKMSISIAGFTALFVVLKPSHIEWSTYDKVNLIRFYMMIELACIVTLFSFLPIVLLGYFDTEISFRGSFGLFNCIGLLYLIYTIRRNKHYTGKVKVAGYSTIIVMVFGIFIILLSILGALNLIGNNYKANYLLLLFLSFCLDIYLFVRLIYFGIKKN